jgi:hypothetical protein
MNIFQFGAELIHAGGQTDRHDKLTVAFLNFGQAPKKETIKGYLE